MRAAGKAEINVQFRKMRLKQIIRAAIFPQTADRDRRINIVKSFYGDIRRQHLFQRGNAVREIRADHRDVGIAQLGPYGRKNLFQFSNIFTSQYSGWGKSRLFWYHSTIVFKKYNAVPTTMQRLAQRAKCGRVSVAPGRSNRKSKNSDLHKLAISTLAISS